MASGDVADFWKSTGILWREIGKFARNTGKMRKLEVWWPRPCKISATFEISSFSGASVQTRLQKIKELEIFQFQRSMSCKSSAINKKFEIFEITEIWWPRPCKTSAIFKISEFLGILCKPGWNIWKKLQFSNFSERGRVKIRPAKIMS